MQLNLTTLLLALLIVAGIAVLIALVRLLLHVSALTDSLAKTSDETTKTISELRDSIVPIINKAEITVDALNAEMVRVDGIISSLEATTARVNDASEKVTGIVSAPAEIVSGVADRMLSMWREKKVEQKAHQLEQRVSTDAAVGQEGQTAQTQVAKHKKKAAYYRIKG